jgi:hypothetical protein
MTEAPWQYQNSLGLDVTTQCYDCYDACLWYSMVRSSKTTDSQGGTVFFVDFCVSMDLKCSSSLMDGSRQVFGYGSWFAVVLLVLCQSAGDALC